MEIDAAPIRPPSEEDPRHVLQALWDVATRECGAARVTIVNEIDDEHIPSSIDASRFRYCELDYFGSVGRWPSLSSLSINSEPQQRGFAHRSACRV